MAECLFMSRSDALLSMFDASGQGLEIGPSFNPLLPKSGGYRVDILDHLTADGLRDKYRNAGVDISRIEEVDYVSDGGSIAELIGKRGHYDYCVALHVIEHSVDLIGFLKDCECLLKPEGVLVLAVPDKRFGFDILRPCSSTGDVLRAHLQGAKVHDIGKIFDEMAYNCLRGGHAAWPPGAPGDLAFFRSLPAAQQAYERFASTHEFVDIHAWQFTPSSFRLIAHDLAELGMTMLRERGFIAPGSGEFYVTLSKQAAGYSGDRLRLAQEALMELAVT